MGMMFTGVSVCFVRGVDGGMGSGAGGRYWSSRMRDVAGSQPGWQSFGLRTCVSRRCIKATRLKKGVYPSKSRCCSGCWPESLPRQVEERGPAPKGPTSLSPPTLKKNTYGVKGLVGSPAVSTDRNGHRFGFLA